MNSYEQAEIERIRSVIEHEKPDFILDIHTTRRSSGAFIITDSVNGRKGGISKSFSKMPIFVMAPKMSRVSLMGAYNNAVSIEYSLNEINERTTSDFIESIKLLLSGGSTERERDIYYVKGLISENEFSIMKIRRNFLKHNKGVALMVPNDKSEMDAEYYGFWTDHVITTM